VNPRPCPAASTPSAAFHDRIQEATSGKRATMARINPLGPRRPQSPPLFGNQFQAISERRHVALGPERPASEGEVSHCGMPRGGQHGEGAGGMPRGMQNPCLDAEAAQVQFVRHKDLRHYGIELVMPRRMQWTSAGIMMPPWPHGRINGLSGNNSPGWSIGHRPQRDQVPAREPLDNGLWLFNVSQRFQLVTPFLPPF